MSEPRRSRRALGCGSILGCESQGCFCALFFVLPVTVSVRLQHLSARWILQHDSGGAWPAFADSLCVCVQGPSGEPGEPGEKGQRGYTVSARGWGAAGRGAGWYKGCGIEKWFCSEGLNVPSVGSLVAVPFLGYQTLEHRVGRNPKHKVCCWLGTSAKRCVPDLKGCVRSSPLQASVHCPFVTSWKISTRFPADRTCEPSALAERRCCVAGPRDPTACPGMSERSCGVRVPQ